MTRQVDIPIWIPVIYGVINILNLGWLAYFAVAKYEVAPISFIGTGVERNG